MLDRFQICFIISLVNQTKGAELQMAVTTTEKRVSVSIKLNNGRTETGAQKTLSVSLGSLKTGAFDREKAMNIVNLLGNCFDLSILETQQSVLNVLVSE